MGNLDNVTASGSAASNMKKHGRYGDTEMAHVTPGEVVVPKSAQTPDVLASLQNRFNELGVPMERYVVRSTKNSKNPQTKKSEYFLETVAAAVAGPLINKAMGGGGSSGGGGGAVPYPTEANPLVQPVKAIAEGAAPIQNLAQVSPFSVASSGMQDQSMMARESNPQPISPSQSIVPVGGNSVSPVAMMFDPNKINPQTGLPEYFDESPRQSSMNPYTKSQEFYGWTNNSQNANDWAVANWNNFTPAQQQQVVNVLSTIPVQAGEGRRSDALNTNAALNNQISGQLQNLGFQVGTGGDTYAAPSTAPNSPAPANNNTTPAYVAPSNASGNGNTTASTSSPKTITGLYKSNAYSGGNNRVMTSDGGIYEVVQDPNTNALTYNKVNDLSGYSQAMGKDNLGLNTKPETTFRYGNNNVGYNYVNVGGSFDYTDPNATKENTSSGIDTPNGQQYGNTNNNSYTAPTYSNIDKQTTDQKDDNPYKDYDSYFANQRTQFEDWMKSMEDRLTNFTNQNTDSGTGGGATDSSGSDGSTGGGSVLDNVSGLSPDRGPRFRSGRGVGSRASGF